MTEKDWSEDDLQRIAKMRALLGNHVDTQTWIQISKEITRLADSTMRIADSLEIIAGQREPVYQVPDRGNRWHE